nr:MAG TPA: hypothetical protein [Caudoviricetes sp.]
MIKSILIYNIMIKIINLIDYSGSKYYILKSIIK